MTAKTKQEALCCQDLSVRCARAEMERDAARESADQARKWSGMTAEAYSRQELRTAEMREKLEKANLALVAKGNEAFRARQLAGALLGKLSETASPGYVDIEGMPPEESCDWSTCVFVALVASGLGAWIYGLIKLIGFLAGRFA